MTQRRNRSIAGALAALALACACQSDPESAIAPSQADRDAAPEAPRDARAPDATADAPPVMADAGRGDVRWEAIQYRHFPAFYYPWRHTFFEAQGMTTVEVRATGEFWVGAHQQSVAPPGGFDPGYVMHGQLDAAGVDALSDAVGAASPFLVDGRRYGCNLCGGECTFRGLALLGEAGLTQTVGDEYFGPGCDPDFGDMPPELTRLAVALTDLVTAVNAGATNATRLETPPRVRVGAVRPEFGFQTPPSLESLNAASQWPFAEPSLEAIVAGPLVRETWWETAVTGEAAAQVWAYCVEMMAADAAGLGPGPFLAKAGEAVFAVGCAPALPGSPWVE